MNSAPLLILERIIASLWVGALWAVGFLAVPILFSQLDDRMLAGALAGHMFTALSYVGLVAGFSLLALIFLRPSARWRRSRLIMVAVMVILVIIGEFVFQPMMAQLKQLGLVAGSEPAARFAVLHGIASILYLINSLLGVTVIALSGGEEVTPSAG